MAEIGVVHMDLMAKGGGEAVSMNVLEALQDEHDVTLLTLTNPDLAELNEYFNTSSTAGFVASPGLGHYTAAKHGVIGLTMTLAVELAPHDITVNAVCPTAVDTPMTGGIVESIDDDVAELAEQSGPDNLLDEILQPEDVSAAFMWLSSDDARFVTGIALPVAAGATAL